MLRWLGKLAGWVADSLGAADRLRGAHEHAHKASDSRAAALRPYLSGRAPGSWASDHFREVQHLTGWSFVANRAIARSCAGAQLAVYEHAARPGPDPEGESRALDRALDKALAGHTEAGDPDRRAVPEWHPLVQILKHPNPEQSGASFRYQIGQQLDATGTALVWIVKNRAGVPVELYILPTAVTRPQPPSSEFPAGSYRILPLGSWQTNADPDQFVPTGIVGQFLVSGAVIDARDVKPIRWPHPLYLSDGFSCMSAGARQIDIADQIDNSRWYSFKNASSPGLLFSFTEDIRPSPEDRDAFREDLKARAAGTPNTGKDLILPPGLKAEPSERTPAEMGYLESADQARATVLALHGTPPVAAGISEAGSYAAYYASLQQFTELTVQPDLDLIAGELTKALAHFYGEHLEVELKARAINDPEVLEKRVRHQILARSITINEERALRGMAPVPWGEVQVGTDVLQMKLQQQAQTLGRQQMQQQQEQSPAGGGDRADREEGEGEGEGEGGGDMDEEGTGVKDPSRPQGDAAKSSAGAGNNGHPGRFTRA